MDREFAVDQLKVAVFKTRSELGLAAAVEVKNKIRELLAQQKKVRMIFAAAPSQNEFLEALSEMEGIDWSRIVAFHMDDYLGLRNDAPQRFSSYLKEHIFEKVHPGQVHYLLDRDSLLTRSKDAAALSQAVDEECERYSRLLKEAPIDIVCMGIGENGHIAFNDPPVADFADPKLVKRVTLIESCRIQQVHDGCFPRLADVPTDALTLTVPALMSAKWLFCMVPGATKRDAVRRTIHEDIATECPATVLRRHENVKLYLDTDSAAELG